MAKETMIVFVYDTECLKDEADDPVNAVLYFHPSWVSDSQKVALCGQLMGTTYFLKDCFFKPKVLALQNGKFVLKEFGRFILAVGTDRNISDYLLQQRADLLAELIRLFHRNLQTISEQFSTQSQYKNLSDKLYHIFETYLPILQRNGHNFQNVPKLGIPKTASNIFLDAIQTLQCCQQTKGILGGAILYHNKVVATQLSDTITRQLVLTDPFHIRTTAEQINSTDFHIPNGVQMIIVYIDALQYRQLAADAQRAQHLQTTQLSQGVLPFAFCKRKMKRDKSLIFTHIPEEEGSNLSAGAELVDSGAAETTAANNAESQPPAAAIRPKSLLMRPTHLPLRMKNMSAKELPESGIASINFDETDSYPEFIGRTSVCSTPMTENKVLHVANIMSICANPVEENNLNKLQSSNNQNRRSSLKADFEKFFNTFMSNSNKQIERRSSLTDLQDSFKKISKKLSMKQLTPYQEQKTDVNRNGASANETPDFIENDDDGNIETDNSSENSSISNNKSTHTISDPTNPVFNSNGQPISRSLFQELLEKYYKLCDNGKVENKPDEDIIKLIAEFHEFDEELKKLNASLRQENVPSCITAITAMPNLKTDRNLNFGSGKITPKTPLDKKTLSLPLKPLADATPLYENGPPLAVLARKQSGGVPLTPLMAKLSVLALNEEQRTNWDATPGGGNIDVQTPLTASKAFAKRGFTKCDDVVDALMGVSQANSKDDGQQRVELYICGQQNMTLHLLMESGSAVQQNIVQKMFDICVAKFPQMEAQLNQSLNVNVEGDKRDGSYSFMCVDSKWDAYESKGPWNPAELITLEHMQRKLREPADVELTDLILRAHDTVFYGYKSGRNEIFYKEPVSQHTTGIPPPSDIMGSVAMRAKKRLERDHAYILF